jgi:hypothetical protein
MRDTPMKSRKVKIKATGDGAGGVEFEVDGLKPHKARLKLDKDSGKHLIEFELHDQSGLELSFDAADPIWVDEDCPCPPAQGLNSDQVELDDCGDRLLKLVDGNWGRERELRYQLNFVGNDGSRSICDPVILNGGGIKT